MSDASPVGSRVASLTAEQLAAQEFARRSPADRLAWLEDLWVMRQAGELARRDALRAERG